VYVCVCAFVCMCMFSCVGGSVICLQFIRVCVCWYVCAIVRVCVRVCVICISSAEEISGGKDEYPTVLMQCAHFGNKSF